MASDVAATSGRLANYTKTEEKHNAKVNSQSVPTSNEQLRRESWLVANAVSCNNAALRAYRSVGQA